MRRNGTSATDGLRTAVLVCVLLATVSGQQAGSASGTTPEPDERVEVVVTGRVLGNDGAPLPGARVRYVPSAGGRHALGEIDLDEPQAWAGLAATLTQDDGRFRLLATDVVSSASPAGWTPRGVLRGYVPEPLVVLDHHDHATHAVPLPAVGSVPVAIGDQRLEPGAVLRLRVRDPRARDVTGGFVRITRRLGEDGWRPRASDLVMQRVHVAALRGEGTVLLPGIAPGRLELRVESPGYRPFERDIELDAPGPLRLDDVTLDLGVVSTGRVIDARGEPVEGAEVLAGRDRPTGARSFTTPPKGDMATWRRAPWLWARAVTDAWGGFVLRGLPPREWLALLVDHPDHELRVVTGSSTGVAAIEVTLSDPASWLLTVVDRDGRGVADATGSARWREHPWDDRDGIDDRLTVLHGEQAAEAAGRAPDTPGLLWLPVAGDARTDVVVSAPGFVSQVVVLPGLAPPASGERLVVLEPAPALTVRLVDADGAPLAGALVTARLPYPSHDRPRVSTWHLSETSDAAGRVTLALPLRGEWTLLAEHLAATGELRAIDVPDDATALDLGDWELSAGGALRGVLYDRAGRPLPGEVVQAERVTPDPWALATPIPSERPPWTLLPTTRSDARGRFTLTGLRPGPWRVLGPDGSRDEVSVTLDAPAWALLDVPGPTRIHGVVLDRGQPVEGAEIRDVFVRGEPPRTNADGRFEGLLDVGYLAAYHDLIPLRATVGGPFHQRPPSTRAEASTPLAWVPIERGCDHWVQLAFQHGELAGVVRDAASGRPLAGIQVWASRETETGARLFTPHGRAHTVTDGEGRFRLTRLAAGRWMTRARATGYVSWSGEPISIATDEHIEALDIALQPAAALRGTVHLDDGSKIPERTAARLLDAAGRVVAEADMLFGDGSFALLSVPPGRYRLLIAPDASGDDSLRWIHVYASAEVELVAGEERNVELVAQPWPGWPEG